jgi:hypothetical protein
MVVDSFVDAKFPNNLGQYSITTGATHTQTIVCTYTKAKRNELRLLGVYGKLIYYG